MTMVSTLTTVFTNGLFCSTRDTRVRSNFTEPFRRKKSANGTLSLRDESFNRLVSSDRVLVENYFGKMCTLWALAASKWRLSEGFHESLFRIAFHMTSCSVKTILFVPGTRSIYHSCAIISRISPPNRKRNESANCNVTRKGVR